MNDLERYLFDLQGFLVVDEGHAGAFGDCFDVEGSAGDCCVG